MLDFSKRFANTLLKEADSIAAAADEAAAMSGPPSEPTGDEEAFDASLDPNTQPDEFNDVDGDGVADAQANLDDATAADFEAQSGTVMEWIGRVEDFAEFLNGMNPSSMQSQLNNAVCDTMLKNVSKSETKKITRIAQELAALKEALKGYLLSSDEGDNLGRQGPQQ